MAGLFRRTRAPDVPPLTRSLGLGGRIAASPFASALLIPALGSAWLRLQFAKKLFPQHTIKGPP